MTRSRSWAAPAFCALAVGISTCALVVARQGPASFADTRIPITIAKFGPSLAGLLIAAWIGGSAGVRDLLQRATRWRIHPGWWVLALLGPAALFALGLLVATGGSPGPSELTLATAPGLVLAQLGRRIVLGGGLGEELGWRGVLLPLLLPRLGAVPAAAVVGVVAGLWHAPANGVGSALALTALTLPWSLILAWMYFASGRSLIPCILAHGAGNAWAAVLGASFPSAGSSWMLVVVVVSWALAAAVAPRLAKMETVRSSRGDA